MTNLKSIDHCFQCGEDLILIKTYTEIINNSKVTTTLSVCSDPACQKRTEALLKKEKERRDEAMNSKAYYSSKRNSAQIKASK